MTRPSGREIEAALERYSEEHDYGRKSVEGQWMIDGSLYGTEDAHKIAESHLILGMPIRSALSVDFVHALVIRISELEDAVRRLEVDPRRGG